MPILSQTDHLTLAREAWEKGQKIIDGLMKIALQMPKDRVGDEDGFKTWTRGPDVTAAAESLIELFRTLKMHLRALAGEIDSFPSPQLHSDDREFVDEPDKVRPWMLGETAVPNEPTQAFGPNPMVDWLAMEICDSLEDIICRPVRDPTRGNPGHVELTENNSRRWREWFQENASIVALTAGPESAGLLTEPMTIIQLATYFRMNRNTMSKILGDMDGVVKTGGLYRVPVSKMPPKYHIENGLMSPQ